MISEEFFTKRTLPFILTLKTCTYLILIFVDDAWIGWWIYPPSGVICENFNFAPKFNLEKLTKIEKTSFSWPWISLISMKKGARTDYGALWSLLIFLTKNLYDLAFEKDSSDVVSRWLKRSTNIKQTIK